MYLYLYWIEINAQGIMPHYVTSRHVTSRSKKQKKNNPCTYVYMLYNVLVRDDYNNNMLLYSHHVLTRTRNMYTYVHGLFFLIMT